MLTVGMTHLVRTKERARASLSSCRSSSSKKIYTDVKEGKLVVGGEEGEGGEEGRRGRNKRVKK